MDLVTDERSDRRGSEVAAELAASGALDDIFARIDAGDLELTGDGGFIPGLIKAALERGLQAELTDHLGYEKGSLEASLFGHIKGEWPHLEKITDPSDLAAELDRVRAPYNDVRLHASIGYVTPDDEHEGRGDALRKARRDGLDHARQQRLDPPPSESRTIRSTTMSYDGLGWVSTQRRSDARNSLRPASVHGTVPDPFMTANQGWPVSV
jgi:hypothetical protein